jgi:YfiH family protein
MLVPQTAPPFPLAWGFSTKLDGPEALPKPELSQVHGCGVVEAKGSIQEADGIWTTRPGLRIGVRVADCVPILLAGPLGDGRPWVSALHAGWRGAVGGIFRRGVETFRSLGGDPSCLAFAFGPAIQACHFEVGEEVITAAKADAVWHDGLRTEGPRGKPHMDLHGFLRVQAKDLGLNPSKDGSIPLCTMCQTELLWSYRRGDTQARQWGWVEILA